MGKIYPIYDDERHLMKWASWSGGMCLMIPLSWYECAELSQPVTDNFLTKQEENLAKKLADEEAGHKPKEYRKYPPPHNIACNILADIIFWHKPVMQFDEQGATAGYGKRFAGPEWYIHYKTVATKFGFSLSAVKEAVGFLEERGLITKRTVTTHGDGGMINRRVYITPVFEKIDPITENYVAAHDRSRPSDYGRYRGDDRGPCSVHIQNAAFSLQPSVCTLPSLLDRGQPKSDLAPLGSDSLPPSPDFASRPSGKRASDSNGHSPSTKPQSLKAVNGNSKPKEQVPLPPGRKPRNQKPNDRNANDSNAQARVAKLYPEPVHDWPLKDSISSEEVASELEFETVADQASASAKTVKLNPELDKAINQIFNESSFVNPRQARLLIKRTLVSKPQTIPVPQGSLRPATSHKGAVSASKALQQAPSTLEEDEEQESREALTVSKPNDDYWTKFAPLAREENELSLLQYIEKLPAPTRLDAESLKQDPVELTKQVLEEFSQHLEEIYPEFRKAVFEDDLKCFLLAYGWKYFTKRLGLVRTSPNERDYEVARSCIISTRNALKLMAFASVLVSQGDLRVVGRFKDIEFLGRFIKSSPQLIVALDRVYMGFEETNGYLNLPL